MLDNNLIPLEDIDPKELFAPGGSTVLIEKICEKASKIVPDASTAKGRKEIASLAHKVARAKTFIDECGKVFVSDLKKKAKVVDVERAKVREALDNLKTEVRAPLTKWERDEEERVAKHKHVIDSFEMSAHTAIHFWQEYDLAAHNKALAEISEIVVDESLEEFQAPAQAAKDNAIQCIKEAIQRRETHDAEQAELAKLREADEKRRKEEHEEQLRKEGEERARKEAEQAAKNAKAAQAKAEADAKAAQERADKAAEEEREKIAKEQREVEQAEAKRRADRDHRAIINNEILAAIMDEACLKEKQAKPVVEAIAKGYVPHVSIKY